jgi:sulfide:quinone oxidoreductase
MTSPSTDRRISHTSLKLPVRWARASGGEPNISFLVSRREDSATPTRIGSGSHRASKTGAVDPNRAVRSAQRGQTRRSAWGPAPPVGSVPLIMRSLRDGQPPPATRRANGARAPRVVIAGGGVAGAETLLALNALVGDRVQITVVAPETNFVDVSMFLEHPFEPRRFHHLRLRDIATELGAHLHRGVLDRVEAERHLAVTRNGDRLPYDRLVIAIGARPERVWASPQVLTYRGGSDNSQYRLLLRHLREGWIRRVAFVVPAGTSWPLPLYNLALATAADCAAHHRSNVAIKLVTPEERPLEVFGRTVSAGVLRLLQASGVSVYTSSYGSALRHGRLDLVPGGRHMRVDRVVTAPRLFGPRLRGIPCDRNGYVTTDAHGRVGDQDGLFAAGDATTFAIKHGGLAAQQADAVADQIAASVGLDIDPRPFRPILRDVLLTGGRPRYLHADISGGAGDDSTISEEVPWSPPDAVSGRYLAPYLAGRLRAPRRRGSMRTPPAGAALHRIPFRTDAPGDPKAA